MYALVHTLPVYDGARCVDGVFTCGLAQTWSLVVEVTFYAVLPAYALLVARLTRRMSVRGWMVCELLLLAALSALSVLLEFPGSGSPPGWISGSLIAYMYWFALGMAMAIASVALADSAPRPRPELLWLLAAAIYVGLSLWLPGTSFVLARDQRIVTHLAFGAIAALMVAPAVFSAGARSLPRRLLAHPLVAWLGLISYGIFLWHYAVALELGPAGAKASFWIVLAGTLALSVGCAAASYYVVERPLLRLKYRTLAGDRRWRTGRSPLPGPTHRARNPRA
jgi:peptidoglycan/LPS O-acetylase OafA/YrhL